MLQYRFVARHRLGSRNGPREHDLRTIVALDRIVSPSTARWERATVYETFPQAAVHTLEPNRACTAGIRERDTSVRGRWPAPRYHTNFHSEEATGKHEKVELDQDPHLALPSIGERDGNPMSILVVSRNREGTW